VSPSTTRFFVAACVVPSLLVAAIGGYLLRRFAPRWNLVDRPGDRKIHDRAMPLGGGLAIWLGVVAPLAVGQIVIWLVHGGLVDVAALPQLAQDHLAGLLAQSHRLWTLLIAATVLMLLGLADDVRGVAWPVRLVVQTLVALLMVWQGWRLTLFLDMPLLTALLSVVWIVGLINSFNMLDNMDGLSAGVAAIAAGILAAVMLLGPNPEADGPQLFVAGFLLVLLGALLGFLWHNHAPARLFMGDAGSYFIGFCLACATLSATFAGDGVPRHAILAPLCVLAVPIYDTMTVVFIRLRQGRSPFVGDKSHFSHRLVELGLSRKQAVWTIYLATATCGLGALLLHEVQLLGAAVVLTMVAGVLVIAAILETTGRRNSR